MIPTTSSLGYYETAWIAVAFVALIVCMKRLVYSWGDVRVVRRHAIHGPRRIVADGWMRRSILRTIECALLLTAGIIAGYSPTPAYIIAPNLRFIPHLLIGVSTLVLMNALLDDRDYMRLRAYIHGRAFGGLKRRASDHSPVEP